MIKLLTSCMIMIGLGAAIMSYSIYAYYNTLKYMKKQDYDQKLFRQWIYNATLLIMVFFLIGYVMVAVMFLQGEYEPYYSLISLIFFFGGVFVFVMVKVQKLMSVTIAEKTTEIIQSMIRAIEAKDNYTKGHSEHVCKLTILLYNDLPDEMRKGINLVNLRDAAILHDIGKIGIPDSILNKPGKLTAEEFEVIKSHPGYGKQLLEGTSYNDILDWILYHHEKLDGSGYYHLTAEQIPLEAKMIAIADIFSALFTDRVYRKKFSYDQSIAILQEEAGKTLDAELVEIFCSIPEEVIVKM